MFNCFFCAGEVLIMSKVILGFALGGMFVILSILLGTRRKMDEFETKRWLGKSVLDDFDAERKNIDDLMK